ncbi:alpha/beta hydrolase [Thalassococcus sp. S3]|uniref:alpha/beta hydrolase n=1 Tax=Thalassococcus sp. S3 TaxID=2017482 RepID=UPI0010245952|nr:alpha/beta hydrolase [Thalassococcus sp. S3]QBF33171.1 alpha/beta hydrolase [Thalassococcus sp. S3]
MGELDDAYANGAYIAGAADYPPRWAAEASAFRDGLGARAETHSYGPGEREAFDLFHPEAEARGTVIFVHGGYWRAFDRSSWSHLAQGPLAAGWAVAMPSYDLCPNVRISDITQQVARATEAVAGLTHGPLALAGHSAGGHLVARMLAPGMLAADVAERIATMLPISPLADLEPLRSTSMNDDFQLDAEAARAESPIYQPKPRVPVTVWVGADERPAFLDQAALLAEVWESGHVVLPDRHHFDVIDDLGDPESHMTQVLTGQA